MYIQWEKIDFIKAVRKYTLGESWAQYNAVQHNQMQWVEKRQKAVLKRIEKRIKDANLYHYIQSDPRGASLYISAITPLTDQKYHTEGIAIY